MSSTTPSSPSYSTWSPSRTGWLIAIRIPATKLPSVRCEAKPITTANTAEEARSPPAIARTPGITSSADRRPTKMIAAVMPRRRTR